MQVYIVLSYCSDSQIHQREGVYVTKILAEDRCQEVLQQAQQEYREGLQHIVPENYFDIIHTDDGWTLKHSSYRVWIEEHPLMGLTVTKSACRK